MKMRIQKSKKGSALVANLANSWVVAAFCLLHIGVAAAEDYSGGAVKNSAQAVEQGAAASGHSAASAGHAMAASGKATIGASAAPMAVSGKTLTSAGTASTHSAKHSAKAANAPIGKPLEITEEAIITTPPNVELKSKPEQKAGR